MGFLDNSGDIILDAVLTDTGRFRLAKGDGSFKITKYAFADDEIDYEKFDKNHASGSAYYDLDILKTPVLEAFTNNTSTMKHMLLSIPRTNLLYLPMLKLEEGNTGDGGLKRNATTTQANTMFAVAVDEDTEDELFNTTTAGAASDGVLGGATFKFGRFVRVDQGLDTTEISRNFTLDPDLRETRYIVEIDNRLGFIVDSKGTPRTPSFIDDDNVATYNFSFGADTPAMINNIGKTKAEDSSIAGPRGTKFTFGIGASLELNTSTFLFTKLGTSSNTWSSSKTTDQNFYFIDTNIRVTGGTTGYRIDLPVRFVKKA
jgi:hypothetical protein